MTYDPLWFASWLVDQGVPIFVAPPCPGAGKCERARNGDDTCGNEFHLPSKWETARVNKDVVGRWREGWAMCAVMGHTLDAVDIDPRNGGDLSIADGISAVAFQETPSGGKHLFIPALGVRKVQNILPGVDLQAGNSTGGHGFVFVFPTVRTSKTTGEPAEYFASTIDETVSADANGWLRTIATKPEPPQRPVQTKTEVDPAREPYVRNAVRRLVDEYVHARPGDGERALFSGACRIFELDNAPWAPIDLESALRELESARTDRLAFRSLDGGGQSEQDFQRVILSAQRHVGGSAASEPRETTPLSVNGRQIGAEGAATARRSAAAPIRHPDSAAGTPTAGEPGGASDDDSIDPAVMQLLAEFLDSDGLESIPDPKWLVKDWLMLDSTASLVGRSGHMKSFVALDIACHVALGEPWHGHKVRQGLVVYIVAEGASGIKKRVRAWEKHYGRKAKNLILLPRPVQAKSDEWIVLIRLLKMIKPVLFIADTQARVTLGMNEDSNSEMGQFVERVEQMRRHVGCCCLVVHHFGKAGADSGGRGASAMYAAWTTEITVLKEDTGHIRVLSTKEKDSPDDLELEFYPIRIELGTDSEGEQVDSIVLRPVTEFQRSAAQHELRLKVQDSIISAIDEHYPPPKGATLPDIISVLHGKGLDNKNLIKKIVKEMYDNGLLRFLGNSSSRYEIVRPGR